MNRYRRADQAYVNGRIITVNKTFDMAQALTVKEGVITAVGSNDDIKPLIDGDTQVIDLNGRTMLPGINESHMHGPFFGSTRPPLALNLTYPAVGSIQDMVEALERKAKETKPGEWIRGFGWDQSSLAECKNDPARLPRRWDLDRVSPDHPVAFMDFSCHTLLVNSKALERAGVGKDTLNPPSGEMERDDDGRPTGIFKEPGAQELVSIHVPLLTRDEKKTALITTMKHLNANGVTSFTDAAIGPGGETYLFGVMSADFVELYQELLTEGRLTTRVMVLLLLGNYGALTYDDLKNGLDTFPVPKGTDPRWLQFSGVKIFADGIPLTYTSWMNEDYVSGNAGHGVSVIPGIDDGEQKRNLIEMIKLVHHHGYQIGLHATGDRAIDAAVEGFARAIQEKPGDPRHYVIHGDFAGPEACRKLAELNCGVAMQPTINTMICDFEVSVVGEERAANEWPMRTAWDSGLNLTSSSDAPVTYPNWLLGIENAVLRKSMVSGKVSGPHQALTVAEAIGTYTINGAYQDHADEIKGSIEPGKLADFCVIDRNILEIDPHEIGQTRVLKTIVGGKVVYETD